MKITIDFNSVEEYLEYKEITAPKEQLLIKIDKPSILEVDLNKIPYLSDRIQQLGRNV